jgi:hypothetical protein
VDVITILALEDGYWLSGALTIVAAVIVTVVILVSSRSGDTR